MDTIVYSRRGASPATCFSDAVTQCAFGDSQRREVWALTNEKHIGGMCVLQTVDDRESRGGLADASATDSRGTGEHDSHDANELPRLVLASQSPRRREMLRSAGASFCCLVPGVDEDVGPCDSVEQTAIAIASRKAHAAADVLSGNPGPCPIVACDTMVVLGDPRNSLGSDGEEILGKPTDVADARRMLGLLSGTTHRVVSGVSILRCDGDARTASEVAFAETTHVTFKQLDGMQINEYIATGEPFDKAGAYGIQGAAGAFVERIDGGYDNVVGLPLARTLEALRKIKIEMEANMHESNANSQEGSLSAAKAAVRKQMKAIRQLVPEDQRAAASQQVCRHLMQTPEFEQAEVIAAYCAFGSELGFDYLAQNMPQGKTFAVPITMANRRMEFVAIDPVQVLPGHRTLPFLTDPAGITSVPEDAEVLDAANIDLMLVPGLGFDDHGYRIGYGGGYYDVYMKREGFRAACFGTFFEQQHYAGSLPHNDDDVPLPTIITQQGVRRF